MRKKTKGIKIRRSWRINPKTKVKKSKKIYSRKKKRINYNDYRDFGL